MMHYAGRPFIAVCGADEPNQHTTDRRDLVTCAGCLRILLDAREVLLREVNARLDETHSERCPNCGVTMRPAPNGGS